MVSYLSIRFVQQYFLLITGYVLATATTYAQTIRYVSPTGPNATPATAMSWANSTSDLQGAINASQPGDQVWVAAGTYKPGGNANTDRTISFSMKNGVAIYGGFTGTETALNQRPAINPVNGQPSSSTLSGEIGDPSSTSDNSYHVIMNTIELNNTAVLDGFVVTRGNGEGNFPNSAGGGVYNYASGNGSYCSPTFLNCSFIKNSSSFAGGAIYNDGNNSGNCSPVLTNCFFTDNSASVGGAIYTRGADSGISSPVLTNCLFRSNIATSQGGAIFNRGSSAGTNNYVLTNCSFQSNSAVNAGGAVYNTTESSGIGNPILTNCSFQSNSTSYVGGAIYNNTYNSDSAPVLSNCAFQNNTAQWAGGIFTYSYSGNNNSVLTNCSFLNNSARWGGGIYNWGDAGNCSSSLINCSFQGNSATGTGGAMINQTSSNSIINLQLANCILFGNGGESTFGPYYTGTTISATYSIFESAAVSGASQINLTGMGNLLNITTSPFTSTSSVALATCSPAINAGNPVSITALSEPYSATALPTTDLIGSPRIFGGRVDMGAVEYQHHPQCPTRLYVNAGASGSNTGLDWKNAFTNLQDALSYTNSLSLTEIWVAAGVYKPTSTTARDISFSMKNGVTIYGGFVGTETTLSQRPAINPVNGRTSSSTLSGNIGDPNSTTDNSYHVIYNTRLDSTAILDGFVVSGGMATVSINCNCHLGGGIFNDGSSGYLCSPTFINCTIANNYAANSGWGGGMQNFGSSSPTITSCLFMSNSALTGGAINNSIFSENGSLSPKLSNCLFLNNSSSRGFGGAIFNHGNQSGNFSLLLTNCAFYGNSAYQGGAFYSESGKSQLIDCSFLNNSALWGGAISTVTSKLLLSNCSLLNNSATYSGGAMYTTDASFATFTNCILFNNYGGVTVYNLSSTITATYSLFEPTAVSGVVGLDLSGPGNLTNVTTSPFASASSVALAPNSPAINAGDPANSSATVGTTDLAGNPRFVARIDMGAVEFQGLLEVYTLKDGSWSDPSVWSVGRLPQLGERVRLKHTVSVPTATTAQGIILTYDPTGRLLYEAGGKLQLGDWGKF